MPPLIFFALTLSVRLNIRGNEMQRSGLQDLQSRRFEMPIDRQCFHRAHSSVGAIGPSPLLHLTRIGTALAPLVVLEVFKDPQKQYRWIRICSLTGAAVSEGVWALREHRRREEREAVLCR
jgi:hypothetical protein